MTGLHGSWPANDPDGVVLRLWSDRGHIDVTADQLADLTWLVADARRRTTSDDGQDVQYPVGDLSAHGLLWLINRVVFHPRGFALGINPDTGDWSLLGDGTEAWRFGAYPDGTEMDDVGFARAEAFLAAHRPVPAPPSSGPGRVLQPAEPTAHLLERPARRRRWWLVDRRER